MQDDRVRSLVVADYASSTVQFFSTVDVIPISIDCNVKRVVSLLTESTILDNPNPVKIRQLGEDLLAHTGINPAVLIVLRNDGTTVIPLVIDVQ